LDLARRVLEAIERFVRRNQEAASPSVPASS
jgi:hypothetical protein